MLFDTRDQFATGIDADSTSPATERLRDILGNLNVPPLEPVPADHVLTKSFFILPEFPGRFNGGPLWVEASLEATNAENRPVRTGDGVTPDHDHRATISPAPGRWTRTATRCCRPCRRTRCSASMRCAPASTS